MVVVSGGAGDCTLAIRFCRSNRMEVVMTYESRLLADILLIVLPTVMIGGVSILWLLIGDPNYRARMPASG